jgi:hypothetical protein
MDVVLSIAIINPPSTEVNRGCDSSLIGCLVVGFIGEVVEQKCEILTEFLHFVVVNLNSNFEILFIVRESQKSFRTGHKEPVIYTIWTLSR